MEEGNIKEHIKSSKTFQYLEPDELDMLLAYSQIRYFNPGEILLHQGQKSEGMYIIIKGQTLVTAQVLGKGTVNLATLNPGDFLGEVSLIEKSVCTATVTAISETQGLLIPRHYFDMLPNFFPKLHYRIIKGITEEVCLSLQTTGLKIKKVMKETEISPKMAFTEMLRSLSRLKSTTLEKESLDKTFLKKSSFFKVFSGKEFEELFNYMKVMRASKKTVLIKEKERHPYFYIILRGAVQININQNNKTAKLGVLGPMSLFGNIIYVDKNPSMFTHIACEDVVLLKIDAKTLEQLKENNIHLWYKIYDKICSYIVNMEKFAYKFFIRLNCEFYNRL